MPRTLILILAVTALIGVVKGRAQSELFGSGPSEETKPCAMGFAKDVLIINYSVHVPSPSKFRHFRDFQRWDRRLWCRTHLCLWGRRLRVGNRLRLLDQSVSHSSRNDAHVAAVVHIWNVGGFTSKSLALNYHVIRRRRISSFNHLDDLSTALNWRSAGIHRKKGNVSESRIIGSLLKHYSFCAYVGSILKFAILPHLLKARIHSLPLTTSEPSVDGRDQNKRASKNERQNHVNLAKLTILGIVLIGVAFACSISGVGMLAWGCVVRGWRARAMRIGSSVVLMALSVVFVFQGLNLIFRR